MRIGDIAVLDGRFMYGITDIKGDIVYGCLLKSDFTPANASSTMGEIVEFTRLGDVWVWNPSL